ncbi:unnamed protein product [Lepeophtheirus salmonis]|uniref:(salmon louse) hypothetical protein n=1 Tax=Lepeophtheirus salmonis TaxID=72036 RepID=A0A7R8CN31_LEPSM|nr:unnamed protein product [Lepeophtheirus salmonis]CAF2871641.1 unnamed protein product [Lepeophtheirus salmonis]
MPHLNGDTNNVVSLYVVEQQSFLEEENIPPVSIKEPESLDSTYIIKDQNRKQMSSSTAEQTGKVELNKRPINIKGISPRPSLSISTDNIIFPRARSGSNPQNGRYQTFFPSPNGSPHPKNP